MTGTLHIDIRTGRTPKLLTELKQSLSQYDCVFVPTPRKQPKPKKGLPLLGTVRFSKKDAQPCIKMLRTFAENLTQAQQLVSFQCRGRIVDVTQSLTSIKARLRCPGQQETTGITLKDACEFLKASKTSRTSRRASHQIPVCT